MEPSESARDIERRAVLLASNGDYASARELFREVLPTKTVPLHRAEVLQNIGLTYEKEGDILRAKEVYSQILDIDGLQNTVSGISFQGKITGHLAELSGQPFAHSSGLILLFTGVFAGAAIGAAIGAKIGTSDVNIFGTILSKNPSDLRYGGSGIGATLGFFLFTYMFRQVNPILLALGGTISFVTTLIILIEKSWTKGILTLGFILIPFVLLLLVAAAKKREAE